MILLFWRSRVENRKLNLADDLIVAFAFTRKTFIDVYLELRIYIKKTENCFLFLLEIFCCKSSFSTVRVRLLIK